MQVRYNFFLISSELYVDIFFSKVMPIRRW